MYLSSDGTRPRVNFINMLTHSFYIQKCSGVKLLFLQHIYAQCQPLLWSGVVKVENFNVETLLGHGVLRSKCKLELKVDSFCKGVLRSKIKLELKVENPNLT